VSDLAELLAIASRAVHFGRRDAVLSSSTRTNDDKSLLKLALIYRACHPNPTWRGFTRWIA
jgi:hypothetical protein